jgi:hypothetical protein
MKSTYYSAAWTDSNCFIVCEHEHETLVDAVSCIPCAGGYVVGIRNGVIRSLSSKEESEFQAVIRDPFKYPRLYTAVPAAGSPATVSTNPGYAVMTRIKVVDHWSWSTWMCFETHAQAVAQTRKGDKVIRFESEERATLKQEKWSALPRQSDTDPPIRANGPRESLPSRAEGETLVEFVLRLLSALDPAGPVPSEGQQDGSLTSESDKETSIIEPIYMARLILSRLTESELHRLERMRETDIPALIKTLRNPPQTVVKSKSRCQ